MPSTSHKVQKKKKKLKKVRGYDPYVEEELDLLKMKKIPGID